MKAASNLIMWLTLVLLVTLAMVLSLVLLLFVELYCSPLIHRYRRRHLQVRTPTTTTRNNSSRHSQSQSDASPSPLDSLTTPGSFLYPADSGNDIEKQLPQPPENQEANSGQVLSKEDIQKGCTGDSVNGWPLVYISNPIYDEENGRGSRVDDDNYTPFETPDTSPSRLGTDDEEISSKVVSTPPLTPMKKLPAKACSVSLKDAKSLGTSGSDTNSNNGVSSSTSLTPCTSPNSL